MRIGVDVRALQTGTGSATRGIGRYVTDLVNGLLDFLPQDQIVLLGLAGKPLPSGWGERAETVAVEGLVFSEMPKPFYMKLPRIRSNQTLIGRLHTKAAESQHSGFERAVRMARLDVLHLPTAVDVGSFTEGEFRVPTVMTFLDAIPMVYRSEYYDRWAPFLQRHYDRQLAGLKRASRVVAISKASLRDAIRYGGVLAERVVVAYPSIAPAFFLPAGEVGYKKPYVLFCSVPDPHKNPERVIEGFVRAEVEEAMLVFISPNEEPYLGRLREAAKRLGLAEDRLVVTGRVSDGELVALFQGAACLASPSLIEGFGLPAAQALATGTPTIVSSRGSQPEVVGDAGIVVDPEDVGAIAEAMRKLLTNREFAAELSIKGEARAELFRPDRQARELRAIYGEVVEN